jgi:predicted kinase
MELAQASSASSYMIILVGLPGSGKSTFAKMLTAGNADKFIHINQDKLKTRKSCETLCRDSLLNNRCPVIDRCNFDAVQRNHFLLLAQQARIPVDVVVFSYPKDECIQRCELRTNHETIKPRDAKHVVHMIASQYQPPKVNSSEFRRITYISSFQDADRVASLYLNGL